MFPGYDSLGVFTFDNCCFLLDRVVTSYIYYFSFSFLLLKRDVAMVSFVECATRLGRDV